MVWVSLYFIDFASKTSNNSLPKSSLCCYTKQLPLQHLLRQKALQSTYTLELSLNSSIKLYPT
jgi:hypothetical protein